MNPKDIRDSTSTAEPDWPPPQSSSKSSSIDDPHLFFRDLLSKIENLEKFYKISSDNQKQNFRK